MKQAPMPPCARQSPSGIWQFNAGDSGSKQPFWMKKPVNVWGKVGIGKNWPKANRCPRRHIWKGFSLHYSFQLLIACVHIPWTQHGCAVAKITAVTISSSVSTVSSISAVVATVAKGIHQISQAPVAASGCPNSTQQWINVLLVAIHLSFWKKRGLVVTMLVGCSY